MNSYVKNSDLAQVLISLKRSNNFCFNGQKNQKLQEKEKNISLTTPEGIKK